MASKFGDAMATLTLMGLRLRVAMCCFMYGGAGHNKRPLVGLQLGCAPPSCAPERKGVSARRSGAKSKSC